MSVVGTKQLKLDGAEVPADHVPPRPAPLSGAQHAVLRLLSERDAISSTDAGTIVHAWRVPPCHRCARGDCKFRSSDGLAILKRLQDRGLVVKLARGIWAKA